jgi:hypothetical protein
VLLGVQHLMRQLLLVEQAGQQFRVLDRGGADQHRLAALVAGADVGDDGRVLLRRGAIDWSFSSLRIIGRLVGITTVSRP